MPVPQVQLVPNPTASEASSPASVKDVPVEEQPQAESFVAEGDIVESPLVGVAYLAASPDKPPFVAVGDTVKRTNPCDYRSHEGDERSASAM